ncbi:DUF6509 family protein [Paenibacillus glufosinatiresistens]|uniref:DUF6509 family protein n=1 Tax=Paenibacillus glufosinatiresistens TaxID=3070657 RepID=UPI00286D96E5|nr:DUF6509 family protein [Paenibacillus sp. YX.27]
MLPIASYSVEEIRDPFGIIPGKRYELMVELDIPEEDELYSESGVTARVVMKELDGEVSLVTYDLMETTTQTLLDFELEEEEEAELAVFCREKIGEEA